MAGAGSGVVTSTPGGISCGTDCFAEYPSGTAVTLAATPVDGSIFSGWTALRRSGSLHRRHGQRPIGDHDFRLAATLSVALGAADPGR